MLPFRGLRAWQHSTSDGGLIRQPEATGDNPCCLAAEILGIPIDHAGAQLGGDPNNDV
jgi:hypothetical protein